MSVITIKWILLILSFSILGRVESQSTNATCISIETNSWMFNKDNESPCLVWSKIQSLCLSSKSYINVPPLLDQSYGYNLPTEKSTICQCNSVSYSLMSACALCQHAETTIPSENNWSNDCKSYTNDGLGFDESVVKIAKSVNTPSPPSQTYSTTLSRNFPSPTSASSTSTSPSSSSSATNSTTTTSDPGKSEEAGGTSSKSGTSSWGPILGGVAGGIIALVLLILLIKWFMTRNQNHPSSPSGSKNKRIPYPYPFHQHDDKEGNVVVDSRREGDSSFLEMLNSSKENLSINSNSKSKSKISSRFSRSNIKTKNREEELKRRTAELMLNPNSFSDPRTAPLPFTPLSEEQKFDLSQISKLNSKSNTKISTKPKTKSIRFDLGPNNKNNGDILIPPKQRYSQAFSDSSLEEEGVLSPEDFKQSESAFRSNNKSISPLPPIYQDKFTIDHPPSVDFSLPPTSPRPDSEIDVKTLPSIYEPKTGAKTYYTRNSDSGMSGMFSPESSYPITAALTTAKSKYPLTGNTYKSSKYPESQYTLDNYPAQETLLAKVKQKNGRMIDDDSDYEETIGAALGSGKRGSWWDKRWSKGSK
ncbi:uncharacterized protein L201_007473 [Kwoniella dendrophila CBS 6074]|uniref:Uncharacterized protein n=1 Tax=Kwoniella dendrophila CBS 6074 TaxID=1295534 RepID=A0AAX4K5W0_9TREE